MTSIKHILPGDATSTAPDISSSNLTRRKLLAAASAAAGMGLGVSALASANTPAEAGGGSAIRPFRVNIPQEALMDLRRRVEATRWPSRELVADDSQGVRLRLVQQIANHWTKNYDWRRVEAKLNGYPQFVTTIDGIDIHFIHVRSKHPGSLPMIITHGWPGSVIEQLKIIDPLTNPTAHGGRAEDAFDVVIPSLPGHGFSGKPTVTGWDPIRIARAWIVLMQRLGYTQYVAQGGDWGDAVNEQMALIAPPQLLAIHTNMPATLSPEISRAIKYGEPAPANLTAEELGAYRQLESFFKTGVGYAIEMGNRPQSLYALEDSPIGLAGWLLDHDERSLAMIGRVFDGQTEGLTRDDVVDNITLYWLTKTAVTSSRLYWESKLGFFDVKNVKIPVAVSVFPDEIYAAPKSWTQQAFAKLIHFNRLPKGGHFAAWEQPAAFVEELRVSFRGLRG